MLHNLQNTITFCQLYLHLTVQNNLKIIIRLQLLEFLPKIVIFFQRHTTCKFMLADLFSVIISN